MKFLAYQRKWLEDRSRLKLMEKSRQIGMTWTAAYGAVRRTAGARHEVWVGSRDEVQGRLFVEDVRKWAEVLGLALAGARHAFFDADDGGTMAVRFAGGGRVQAVSSNPDAQAGKRGSRILDEFALHPEPRRLYATAYPGITWGGQLEILSTHRGRGSFFNELVREAREGGNPKGFSLHRVTIVDAVEQGLLEALKAKLPPDDPRQGLTRDGYLEFLRQGCADEAAWREEYLCEPADDAGAFLAPELLDRAAFAPGEVWEKPLAQLRGDLYLGVDLGRTHDRTVFWLLEADGGRRLTRRVQVYENEPFARQEEALSALLAQPNLRRVCIDASGLGRQFAERAAERWGSHRAEGLTLTAGVKEALAYPLRSMLEAGDLRIPATAEVRADLLGVRREVGLGGYARFAADRGPGGHSDRFWALALALHAARQPERPPPAFERVGIPQRHGGTETGVFGQD